MASEGVYARGAGAGEQAGTGGEEKRYLSEEEIKERAREDGASWQMPPSGLYVFEIYEISERITAKTADGREYTYRQVLGFMHGKTGNLVYDGEVLLRVIGAQGEILRRIYESESKKCLIDIRKWNGMQKISGIYGLDFIISLLSENGDAEAKDMIKVR